MPEARIEIDIGKEGPRYLRIMDKDIEYKRSSVSTSTSNGKILIKIKADDATALVASMNSMLKQMRVISGVKSALKKVRKPAQKGI